MRELGPYLLSRIRTGAPIAEVTVRDVHAHLGPYRAFPVFGHDADSLVRQMDRLGIASAVIAHHAVILRGGPDTDDPVADAIARHPTRLLGYCCPDPRFPEADAAYVERRIAEGFVGIKLHDCNLLPYAAKDYQPIYELARARRIPVLFHSWHCGDGVRPVMRLFPDLCAIIAHGEGGSDFNRDTLEADADFLRAYPNLHIDFSGAVAPPGCVERLVRAVGSERVLLGTDMPFISPAFNLGCAAALDLDDEPLLDILHRNADRLFSWHGRGCMCSSPHDPGRGAPRF